MSILAGICGASLC